jgi:hypothetical protein
MRAIDDDHMTQTRAANGPDQALGHTGFCQGLIRLETTSAIPLPAMRRPDQQDCFQHAVILSRVAYENQPVLHKV